MARTELTYELSAERRWFWPLLFYPAGLLACFGLISDGAIKFVARAIYRIEVRRVD